MWGDPSRYLSASPPGAERGFSQPKSVVVGARRILLAGATSPASPLAGSGVRDAGRPGSVSEVHAARHRWSVPGARRCGRRGVRGGAGWTRDGSTGRSGLGRIGEPTKSADRMSSSFLVDSATRNWTRPSCSGCGGSTQGRRGRRAFARGRSILPRLEFSRGSTRPRTGRAGNVSNSSGLAIRTSASSSAAR